MSLDTTRRGFLTGAAAALATLGVAPHALGQGAGNGRSFLFVFAQGGWDPTRVFASDLGNGSVAYEPDADRATAGGLSYVSHGTRPSVDAFFAKHHQRVLVVNGLMVSSVQHEVCTQLLLTGSAASGRSDWASQIADAARLEYTLPHLVCGGPSFPGPYTASVARTGSNGQLDALLTGDVLRRSQRFPVGRLSAPAESLVDRYLARRAAGRELAATGQVDEIAARTFAQAIEKAEALEELRHDTDFTGGQALIEQGYVAVDALSRGISRCVTVVSTGGGLGWDTHDNNDAQQAALFEGLFNDLDTLMELLARTPGRKEATLAEETVVVVLSEMGRTPLLNGAAGKDHWPYTSAMLVGPGITGSRVIGAYDEGYFGARMDVEAARLDPNGVRLSPKSLGATLLSVAGIDPAESLPGVPVIRDVLA